jgi:hypothetical protein
MLVWILYIRKYGVEIWCLHLTYPYICFLTFYCPRILAVFDGCCMISRKNAEIFEICLNGVSNKHGIIKQEQNVGPHNLLGAIQISIVYICIYIY